MKDKIWELEFEGRQIRVINRLTFFPFRSGEFVEVDGQLVARGKGGLLSEYAVIRTTIDFAGIERELEIHIGAVQGRFCTTGCHILIDGVLVGGDIEATLIIPELAKSRSSSCLPPYQLLRRLFLHSLCKEGLPFALLTVTVNTPDTVIQYLIQLIIVSILFGAISALIEWRSLRPTLT